MTNQTVKNMELVLLEIRKEVFNNYGDSRAVKTLTHSYQTLLDTIRGSKDMELLVLHLIDLNYILEYIEDSIVPKLLLNKEYVSMNNYTVCIEKLKKIIRSIDIVKFNADIKLNNKGKVNPIIEELLNLSIKSGTLVLLKDEVHRGMGKTTALVKKAHELNCVLICAINSQADYARKIRNDLGLKVDIITPKDVVLRQHALTLSEKGYLIDEMISKEDLARLNINGCKLLGGFMRIVL